MQACYASECHGSTLKIKGKAAAIAVVNCSDCFIFAESVIGTVEIINSERVKVIANSKGFVVDKCSTISIDVSALPEEEIRNDLQIFTCMSRDVRVCRSSGEDYLIPLDFVFEKGDGIRSTTKFVPLENCFVTFKADLYGCATK